MLSYGAGLRQQVVVRNDSFISCRATAKIHLVGEAPETYHGIVVILGDNQSREIGCEIISDWVTSVNWKELTDEEKAAAMEREKEFYADE